MLDNSVWGLVPQELPPETPAWVEGAARRSELTDREFRAYAWAMHLLSRLSNQALSTAVMGILDSRSRETSWGIADISAGFIPFPRSSKGVSAGYRAVRMQLDSSSVSVGEVGYGFGILIGIALPEDDVIAEVPALPSQYVSIDGFPIVAEVREIVRHAPPFPVGVASACYVVPRKSKRFFGAAWSSGILIARHVLAPHGYSYGTNVRMTSGALMPVVDIDTAASTIDAAVIDCGSIPSGVSSCSLSPAVGPGSLVDVRTPGHTFTASVLRVNDHPTYFGNMVAHRVFLDAVGASGDSGSLVSHSSSSDAVGVYIGSTGGTTPEGLVQSMRQIVQYFDVDILD